MYGAILGDVIGSKYEWHNIKSKEFELFDDNLTPTDDSVMTLAVAKSLVDSDKDPQVLKEVLVDNMVEIGRQYSDCGFGGKFYKWIMTDNHEPYGSFGNGAAMRISPVGFVSDSIEEAKELSKIVTEVSHNHPESYKAAEAVSIAIYMALHGCSKEEIETFINRNYYNIPFSLDEIRPSYEFDVTCQGSVPQAFESFFESDSYEDAIRNAISIGGDSDTIAAITGGIAEAYYGIPDDIAKKGMEYLDESQKDIVKRFHKKYDKKRGL